MKRTHSSIAGTPLSNGAIDAAERERAHLAAIIESSDDAIVSKTLDGVVTSWNVGAERLFGYGAQEMIGQSITRIIPAERLSEEDWILSQLRQGRRIEHYETERRRKDGRVLPISIAVSPVRDASGRIIGASKIARDITERKRIEQALRESERSLSNLIANLPGFVFRCRNDEHWSLTFVSERVREVSGYPAEDLIRGRVTWSRLVHPEDIERVRANAAKAIEDRSPVRILYRIVDAVGQVRWVAEWATPVFSATGEIHHWEGFVEDVTDRKQMEEALREADRRKDEFLATLAHELRNPLAPIRTAVQVQQTPGLTDAQRQWTIEVISRQTQHMARLLDDLLDVSRITRGRLELRKEPMAIRMPIEAALETARPLIAARKHELHVDLPSEPIVLVADPIRVTQIVGNLLTNAAKYTDAGGRIHLAVRADASDVVISVRDDGIGMSPEQISTVFEMFMQAPEAISRSAGGLGVGLAITKGLVDLHGGRIEARSEGAGKGSEFVVRLPMGY